MPIGETEADAAALAEFLVGDEWPFHGNSRPSRETVEGWLAAGRFTGPGVRSFWIRVPEADATSPAHLRFAQVAVHSYLWLISATRGAAAQNGLPWQPAFRPAVNKLPAARLAR